MIAIVDYGAGNLCSVVNAVNKIGYQPKVTSSPDDVLNARAVILPGVGAAANTIDNLKKLGLDSSIRRFISENRPFLGVCIGLQILFTNTEEGGWNECLDLIPGVVKRLPGGLKIPHMGWNQVKQQISHPVFNGIPDEANFYFVHSYYAEPGDISVIAATTDYGMNMCSAIVKDNLIATQFHPEKSGYWGLKMYSNFLQWALDMEQA